ncbi:MAG: hypothetical protein ACI3VB_03095 [Oscillospiraceae bacterium]
MKTKFGKILSVILAAIMLTAVLAGCGDESKLEKDPTGYLKAAIQNTQSDILERYSASPIAAIMESVSSGNASFSISGSGETDETGSVGIDATLYTSEAGAYLLDFTANAYNGLVNLNAQLYADSEFVGVACAPLLGDDTFYGVKPYDLYEQAEGSIFDENSGTDYGFDISPLKEIDELLEAVKNSDGLTLDETIEQLEGLSDSFIDSRSYTYESADVSVGTESLKGYVLTTTYTGEDIAALTDQVFELLLNNAFYSGLMEYSAAADGSSVQEIEAEIDEMLAEIEQSTTQFEVKYYIADGKVVSLEENCLDENGNVITTSVINYYAGSGNGISVTVSSDDTGNIVITSTVDDGDAYAHTIFISADGESVSLTTTWDSKSGALSGTLEADGASMSLSGTLNAEKDKGFSFENGELSIVSDGAEPVTLSFSASAENGTDFPAVSETKNLFELTEDEFYAIIYNIYYMFS